MRRITLLLIVLYISVSCVAQTPDSSPQSAKKNKDEITATGCVSKSSTDYILTQPDKGNSYELQGSRKIRLSRYLGQQVEVTGVESPSLSTSSDFLARAGSASPVTISVNSVKTIAKRCSGD
ncbi:MAG TPA: hypothetical protein VKR57_03370 [Terriglobales bacterium]|nr:hypothetical protein [Terriglobales bacterium]